jgi:hypothetical protein
MTVFPLKKRDGALQRFPQPPALRIGNRAELFNGLRAGFEIELRVAPGATPARRV